MLATRLGQAEYVEATGRMYRKVPEKPQDKQSPLPQGLSQAAHAYCFKLQLKHESRPVLTAKTHSPKSTDTRSSKSMPWFAARHAAHPCQTGPRQEVCERNGVISWLGVPSSGWALTNKHISYHEQSKRGNKGNSNDSGALLSGLGGSGAVGFLNAPTGSASLYLQHSLLKSKASEGQKPALETGG